MPDQKPPQSVSHIMVMEPTAFMANSQTKETNSYQDDNPEGKDQLSTIQAMAKVEFRNLRDRLVEYGVVVTSTLGQDACPDDIFCNNWLSTHIGTNGRRQMVLYPMLADNRRTERRPELIEHLARSYDLVLDMSAEENNGQFLESTGAMVMDRVNRRVFSGQSARSHKALAEKWCAEMGYELHSFQTKNHEGKPVYHTDVLMYIGTGYAGICLECLIPEDRERIRGELEKTHEIIELSMDQLRQFAGNALEVVGAGGKKYIAMSQSAHDSLRPDQIAQLKKYITDIIHSPIPTIEKYGGGSVRCMLLELC